MPKRPAEEKVRIYRVLMIDEAIRSGSYPSLTKLAGEVEVSERTILRDIEFLRDMFKAPIENDREKGGYYYSEPNFFIKNVILTEGELFSIALFDRLLEQYRNTPLKTAHKRIFDKIVRSSPKNANANFDVLNTQFSVIFDPQSQIDTEVFEDIFIALKTKQTISFEYSQLQKTDSSKRTADPYHVIYKRGNWHFIGHCHDRNEPKMFSFSRIRNTVLTNKYFKIPSGFKPDEFFDKEMGVGTC